MSADELIPTPERIRSRLQQLDAERRALRRLLRLAEQEHGHRRTPAADTRPLVERLETK